jgi:ArsR family transcriptional regulator
VPALRDDVDKLAEIFKALGDPTRLRILKILVSKTASDVRIADIAGMLNVSQPAVSQHLKILKNIGILSSQREGYRIYYNIVIDVFTQYKMLIDNMFKLVFEKCNCIVSSDNGMEQE